MNILDFVLNWILNWIIFWPDSMKKWIFKTYRLGLVEIGCHSLWVRYDSKDCSLQNNLHCCCCCCCCWLFCNILHALWTLPNQAIFSICKQTSCNTWTSYINSIIITITNHRNDINIRQLVGFTQFMAWSLICHYPPVSLVGRFRLCGQVLLGIENLSLAPRWAETISIQKRE